MPNNTHHRKESPGPRQEVHARDSRGNTELHHHAVFDSAAKIKTLLAAGADPNAKNKDDRTPMHFAAHMNDDPTVVTALASAGGKTDVADNWGLTPLHMAAGNNDSAVVTVLIEAGAVTEARAKRGHTPLHYAALNHRPEVVKALAAAGAKVNARGGLRRTPLHYAVRFRSKPEIASALMEAGAKANARNLFCLTPQHDIRVSAESGPEARSGVPNLDAKVLGARDWLLLVVLVVGVLRLLMGAR